MLPTSDFVGDQQGEEVGVGHFVLDRFAVAFVERVENALQRRLRNGLQQAEVRGNGGVVRPGRERGENGAEGQGDR